MDASICEINKMHRFYIRNFMKQIFYCYVPSMRIPIFRNFTKCDSNSKYRDKNGIKATHDEITYTATTYVQFN